MTRRNVFERRSRRVARRRRQCRPGRQRHPLELRHVKLRNGADEQVRRIKLFLEHGLEPALQRNGR